MKVLIVDDETHVREAIRLLIDWDRYEPAEVLEAANGSEAIALIERHAPQIVLTDMIMPAGGGLDLLEWISRSAPDTKTLVISGHGDFSFARQTLRYGGMDYLLKPIDPDQLNESFARAVESWRVGEENRRKLLAQAMEVNRFKPVYRDKLCSDLLGGPAARETAARELAGEFGLGTPAETTVVRSAVLGIGGEDSPLWRKYGSRPELLFFTLANVANEVLGRGREGYAFRSSGREREVAIFFWSGAAHAAEKLERMNDGFEGVLGEPLHIGLGGCADGLAEGLRASYLQAEEALRRPDPPAADRFVHRFEENSRVDGGGPGPMEQIAAYVRDHYREEVTLQGLAERFFLSREYISRRFKREFGLNVFDYLADVRLDRAKRLLLDSELRVVRIAELVGYQDEKYFSRVFKKATGQTPNEFRRADKAIGT
ncbi:response regulator [Saccharibacillus sp. CPCC 101409]|uniref:response regulator n=1 Tax=Saccharibacillus sp. CPCC 101409 TaxID=3058041 RepID=UPI002672B51F|nr:response regulator [Saccharibacillus sp. CPCC 101409]MDO3412700.1 response regulator [Saccharibacillus sp. CPCC 101409]